MQNLTGVALIEALSTILNISKKVAIRVGSEAAQLLEDDPSLLREGKGIVLLGANDPIPFEDEEALVEVTSAEGLRDFLES